MEETKSAIYGNGYGDKHNWERQVDEYPESSTLYTCRNCPAAFRHFYNKFGQEDIFQAMKLRGVSEECIKKS